MHPYSSAEWESLFLADAGASAALAGLPYVALSMELPTSPAKIEFGHVSSGLSR
jgi:hypothetical protein